MARPRLKSTIAALTAAGSLLVCDSASASPDSPPGSSAVLIAGRVRLRATNQGHLGRLSWDTGFTPGAQWPGPSGTEVLRSIQLFVGAKDPEAPDPAQVRRFSFSGEWQPPTTTSESAIRATLGNAPGGSPLVDDDGDGRVDEETVDGTDEDGDGAIDEDFAGLGDQMLSITMRDDTPDAWMYSDESSHHPLHLECKQRVWAFDHPAYSDFAVSEYVIRNVSGHQLDSVVVGWQVDLASGPRDHPGGAGSDDVALTEYPSATLVQVLEPGDPRRQFPHDPAYNFWAPAESALCPRMPLAIRGFSEADADGDQGRTTAIPSFLLVDHTFDPSNTIAPGSIGFRAFRVSHEGVPAAEGGIPTTDAERYALALGTEGVDRITHAPSAPPPAGTGNPVAFCSIGPFRQWQNGREIRATIVVALATGAAPTIAAFPADRALHAAGSLSDALFLARYPSLANAYAVSRAFEGDHVPATNALPVPDNHGRETALRSPPGGQAFEFADCRDMAIEQTRTVTDGQYTMFDLDCDFCTGAYDYLTHEGLLHRKWSLPEPSTIDVSPLPPGSVTLGTWVPNPSSGSASIRLELERAQAVSASVHDAAGRLVRWLPVDGRAGVSTLVWDGRDARGERAGSGMYWLRLSAGGRTIARRLVRLGL